MLKRICYSSGKPIAFSRAVSIAWITGCILGILIWRQWGIADTQNSVMFNSRISAFGIAASAILPVVLAVVFMRFHLDHFFIILIFTKSLIHGFCMSALYFSAECYNHPQLICLLAQSCSCFLAVFSGLILKNIQPLYRMRCSSAAIFASVVISVISYWIPCTY